MLPSQLVNKQSDTGYVLVLEKKLEKLAQKAFFFLTEPTSSRLALCWSIFTASLVVLIAIFYVLWTVDGPNHYTGRYDGSSYPELPDRKTYRLIDIILWTPLVVDAFFRLLMVIAVFNLPGSHAVADDFDDDTFKKVLHLFDFLSVIPFLLSAMYRDFFNDGEINQFLALLLRGFYLLSCSKILRITKDLTSVLAVRLALGKSMSHLVIPLFFFLVFNIFFGVVLYFLEPCYNIDLCAWKNLFEACFFSVVTMTTTGYGNQVPRYVPARGVSSIIMLFGSLFMSMPLAIIGNEYENAWVELKERLRLDELEQLAHEVSAKMQNDASNRKFSLGEKTVEKTNISDDENNFLKRRKMLRKSLSTLKVNEEAARLANESLMSPLVDSTENLTRVLLDLKHVLDSSKKMNPSLLLLMCELKGWMAPVQWNIQQCMKELAGTDNVEDDNTNRKLSFFRSINGFVDPTDGDENGQGNKVAPDNDPKENDDENEEKDDERETENPETLDSNDNPPKTNDIMTPSKLEISSSEANDEANDKKSHHNPNRHSILTPMKWGKKNAVTPQKSTSSEDNVASLPVIKSRKAGVMDLKLKTGLKRGQSFAIKMVRAAPDIANKGNTNAEDFTRKMERALDNPDSFRTRLWIILEFPHSSKGARILQIFLLCLILFSVMMLYTQTVPTFGSYGESSDICGEVLHVYCPNKYNMTLDPGCFVHNASGVTSERLRYNCDTDDCFGHGYNFGAPNSNVTCVDSQPFETMEELAENHRIPDFLVSRDAMHRLHDVCLRIECTAVEGEVNGNFVWIPVEIFVSICFTIEILSRIFVADSIYHFCWDFLNLFDILAVIPFYIDCSQAAFNGVPLDFRILSSSPEPVLLVAMKSFKVFRLFKMTRHFSASKVLFETANKALTQILGIMSLLLFIVLMFALFLFEVEKGTPCFVGDPGCEVPEANAHEYNVGQRILINKVGDVSSFKTVLESLWFSIVTLTSVGYGDLNPVTNLGQLISIILMLFGAIYLAMPLTVAAATFWSVHQAYMEGKENKKAMSKKLVSVNFAKKIKSLEISFKNVSKMLSEFFDDIQSQQTPEQMKGKPTLLQRCLQVESSLKMALKRHDGDIRRLSAFTISNKKQLGTNNGKQ